ncbi:MAG: hypothetical protein NVS3B20_25300 [Polyangiales bacterium]
MQGSAKLCDGRVVGVHATHPLCFVEIPAPHLWGITASGRSARPFRSIAVDPKVFTLGNWYYVPELDGARLPFPAEGKVHDGCVRADDRGEGVRGDAVDLFVGAKEALPIMAPLVTRTVHLAEGGDLCTGSEEFRARSGD